jgi:transcriptional regulator with XRE-family HTH domain
VSLREDLTALLVRLRGSYTTQQVADALGRTRTAVRDLERAEVSLPRLEWLQDFYGVDFRVVAIDRATGQPWEGPAAPGLVERIEGGLPPMLDPAARPAGRTSYQSSEQIGQVGGVTPVESTGERRSHAR